MAKRNLVFVCLEGKDRSPVFRDFFNRTFTKEKINENYEAFAFGISGEGDRELKEEHVKSASLLVAMDKEVKDLIIAKFPKAKRKLDQLYVEDRYVKGDWELISQAISYYDNGVWRYF
jgi:protein-tyrosine-phosphatase